MLLKTANLRKNIAFIKPDSPAHKDIQEITEEIEEFISSKDCRHNVILDLTGLNVLSCVRIGVLAATHHFIEFVGGKIYIVVQDKLAKKYLELFNLSNTVVIYNQNQLVLDNIA